MTEWQYSQSTGRLMLNGKLVEIGYSGHGEGLNNSECQAIPDVGPIPVGLYKLGPVRDSIRVGKLSIDLDPVGHNACGRTALMIHGDNKKLDKSASHGCIILPRWVRQILANQCKGGPTYLEVIL